jgi:uncharacterized protein (DUF934 family)
MPNIVEGSLATGGRVVEDHWVTVDTCEGLHAAPDHAPVIVPVSVWTGHCQALADRGTPIGVRLEPQDDPSSIAHDLQRFALVAIHIPKFTDGRGYSIARLLRERHGYRGPLRAVGDVLRDQIFYMLRCGFDQFALKHPEQAESALTAYRDFSDAYQTSVERREPLFARRAA